MTLIKLVYMYDGLLSYVQRTVYKCPLVDNIGISLHTCTFVNYPIKSHFNKKINELISNKK